MGDSGIGVVFSHVDEDGHERVIALWQSILFQMSAIIVLQGENYFLILVLLNTFAHICWVTM